MQPSLHVIRGIEDRHDSVVAALSEEHLVVADGTLLRSAELADAAASCVREIQLVCPATKVAISPSSEFVMALDANRARVWHQPGLESVFEIAVDAGRTSVGALFARLGGRDVVLHEPAQAKLDAYDLATGARIFNGSTETFLIDSGVALANGHHVATLGYYRGKASLAVIPLDELSQPPDKLFARFRKKRAIADFAYRLGLGPSGADGLVVFRDPEDDEDDEEDGSFTDTAYADVRGLHGFYTRKLDGTLTMKHPWQGPVRPYAKLTASAAWIAVECEGHVALVSLVETSASHPPIAGRWLAAAPDGSRVLLQTDDSELSILTLPH